MIQTFNLATEQLVQEYPCHVSSEWQAILERVSKALQSWNTQSIKDRVKPLKQITALLENSDPYARIITS